MCTEPFLPLARAVAAQKGLPSLVVVTMPHPMGGVEPSALNDAIDVLVDQVATALVTDAAVEKVGSAPDELVDVPEEVEGFLAFAEEHDWSDGLPLIPPTPDRHRRAMETVGLAPDELLGRVPPSNRGASLAAVAANAVMAGCTPEMTPVVVAAVKAALNPKFNLQAVTTTTHPVSPLLVVSGGVVDALGFNPGANSFGQGNRANATVGRALRLVLQVVGGAIPGKTDRATHGAPTKYSYCIAENSEASPFQTFHDERRGGLLGSVTVVGGEAPHNVNDHGSTTAEGILRNIAGTMATLGSNNVYLRGQMLVVLSPEHAAVIARDGYDRRRVQEALFATAKVDVRGVSPGNLERFRLSCPRVFDHLPANGLVPILDRPEDLLLLVSGGPGKHSIVVPTFGSTEAVTVDVEAATAQTL